MDYSSSYLIVIYLLILLKEGTGFNDVIAHLKSSKSLEFLANYLNERSSAEQEFCKQLQKMSKKFESLNEYGTIQKLFSSIKDEIDKEAELRMKFAQDLKQYANEISSSSKEFKKSQKQNFSEYDKLSKEFKSYVSKVSSAQSKYYKICSDNVQIDAKFQRETDPKVQNKLQQSLLKGQKIQASAEQEYQSAVQKQYNFQPQYFQKTETIFDSLQALEINKKEKIKSSVQNYTSSLRSLDSYISDSVKNISNMLELTNPTNDIESWIKENSTGTKRPDMPKFEPYNSGGSSSISPNKMKSNGSTTTRIEKDEPTEKNNREGLTVTFGDVQIEDISDYEEEGEYGEEYDEEYDEEYYDNYEYVRVIWDYEAREENELSLCKDEIICILSKDDEGWWTGQNENGDVGLFPANYTEIIHFEE